MTTPHHGSGQVPRLAVFLGCAGCFVLYAAGMSLSGRAGVTLDAVTMGMGLLIILTCPGLFISLTAFENRLGLPEHLAAGMALNLAIYPALILLCAVIQIPIDAYAMLVGVGLLTLATLAVWTRPAAMISISDLRVTSGRALVATVCLTAVVLTHRRETLSPIGDYLMVGSVGRIMEQLSSTERDGLRKEDAQASGDLSRWTYSNTRPSAQAYPIAFVSNCRPEQLLVTHSVPRAGAESVRVPTTDLPAPSSSYGYANGDNADREFPERSRVYVSSAVTMQPGLNVVRVRCARADQVHRALDLSLLREDELLRALHSRYLVKSDPEIGDAQEAFLSAKYVLNGIYWANPPLLYPIYRSAQAILGMSMSSITLLELSAFAPLVVLLLFMSEVGHGPMSRTFMLLPVLAVMNYVVAITNLPVLHSAAGLFLLTLLSTVWFSGQRKFAPACVTGFVLCMLRYEGLVLVALTVLVAVVRDEYRIRWQHWRPTVLLLALAAGYLVMCTVWGAGFAYDKRIAEMLLLSDIGAGRITLYTAGAFTLASGTSVFWGLARRTDRAAISYAIIAALYLAFLWSLGHIRPYHLGPFVVISIAAGTRAIRCVQQARLKRLAIGSFLVLVAGAFFLIQRFPRSLCGNASDPACQTAINSE